MKVLTIDDSRTIRLLIKRYLEPLGMAVIEASNGREGVDLAREVKPDLIVLDVTMPVMDGRECLKTLHADSDTENIPVLMLTAETRRDVVVGLIELGVDEYLVKPFNQEMLIQKVSKVLAIGEFAEADPGEEEAAGEEGLPTVLILDDKAPVLEACKRFLKETANVLVSLEPFEAVELATQHAPEVLFLDLVVPGQDIFEIFSILKSRQRLRKSRFVAMAIRTMRDEMARARRAGFHDLLIKPFDQAAIIGAVKANMSDADSLLSYEEDYAAFHFPVFSPNAVSRAALAHQALKKAERALNEIADSGYERLLLDMGDASRTDISLVTCVSRIQKTAVDLGISLSIMVPDVGLASMLRQFSETSDTPIYTTREEAVSAFPH